MRNRGYADVYADIQSGENPGHPRNTPDPNFPGGVALGYKSTLPLN